MLNPFTHLMLYFSRSFLGVNDTTPNRIVLAEFGRFPLILFWCQQALKYKARMSTSLPSRLMSLAFSVQQACQVDKSAGFVSCKTGIQKGILSLLPKCPLVWQACNISFWTLRVRAIGLQTTSDCMAAAPMVFKHTLALWTMYNSESAFHAFVVLTTAWRLKPAAGPSPWKLPFVRDYANSVA